MRNKNAIRAGMLAGVLCLALAACGGGTGQHFTGFVQDFGGGARQPASGSAAKSEITPYQSPAFADSLGFNVTQWPDTAQLTPAFYFAIDGWFGQIEYHTPDERVIVVRVASLDEPSLTTTYTERHFLKASDEHQDVAMQSGMGEDGCMLYCWEQGGFQFSAHSGRSFAKPTTEEVAALVAGLTAEMV